MYFPQYLASDDDPLGNFLQGEDWLLSQLDEYSLFCHYLGFEPEPGRPYLSPVRPVGDMDTVPSFTVIPPKGHDRLGEHIGWVWIDRGRGITGTIFKLVKILHGLKN